jgi:hypothetical protein
LFRKADSLSLSAARKLKTINPISKINGFVIDPVAADLKLSIPKINAMPEICPMRMRKPFEVPSETGYVTSAPY